MPDISAVMDQALAEVKNLGGNVKAINDQVQKELATIRSEVEGLSKGQVTDALVQSKIDAFGASIGTKIEAAQKAAAEAATKAAKAVDARVDAVETAMRRSAVPGGAPEDAKALREAAVAFTKASAALAGRKVGDVLDDGDIDFEGYKAYRKNFGLYLRRDERALSPDHWKALASGSDPDGGYLVEPTVSARIRPRSTRAARSGSSRRSRPSPAPSWRSGWTMTRSTSSGSARPICRMPARPRSSARSALSPTPWRRARRRPSSSSRTPRSMWRPGWTTRCRASSPAARTRPSCSALVAACRAGC